MGKLGQRGMRELPKMAIPSKVKSSFLLSVKLLPWQKDPSSDREGVAENSPLRTPGEDNEEIFVMFTLSTSFC